MKLVIAVIRPEKLHEVLEALFHAEVKGLTIARVLYPHAEERSSKKLPGEAGSTCAGVRCRSTMPGTSSGATRVYQTSSG